MRAAVHIVIFNGLVTYAGHFTLSFFAIRSRSSARVERARIRAVYSAERHIRERRLTIFSPIMPEVSDTYARIGAREIIAFCRHYARFTRRRLPMFIAVLFRHPLAQLLPRQEHELEVKQAQYVDLCIYASIGVRVRHAS